MSDVASRHTTLKGKHERRYMGLCPFHSERHPSFEVNDLKGTYYCHGCGAGGDQIRFLTKLEGMTFRQAVEWLLGDELPVISPEERAQRKALDEKITADRIAIGQTIWTNAVDPVGTPAEVYARSRGIIAPLPPTVRFVMAPRWRDAETGEVGRDHPAMCCALQDATGAVVGVQCVFLMDGGRRKFERQREDGSKAKAKLSFGQIVGSALRLGPIASNVVICEGPEDGLTLMQELPGRTVWVSCGTAMMSRVSIPAGVETITLAGDNGSAGRAAVDEAIAAYMDQGLAVDEVFPRAGFKDWNDQLRGIRA